jgi:hypothetical protein
LSQALGRLFDERLASELEEMLSRAPDARCAVYHETTFAAKSWGRKRRICLKMQNEPAKDRVARYVIVTSSRESKRKVWEFYEHRGQCPRVRTSGGADLPGEQRIDEMRNHLRADKFSCAEFRPNEVKLHLIAMAHNLFAAARAMLPAGHELKPKVWRRRRFGRRLRARRATVARLRTTLVKCGATLVRTVRRLWLHAVADPGLRRPPMRTSRGASPTGAWRPCLYGMPASELRRAFRGNRRPHLPPRERSVMMTEYGPKRHVGMTGSSRRPPRRRHATDLRAADIPCA